LSCESRLSGQSAFTSELLGTLSKLGYKANKLLHAIDKKKFLTQGPGYVRDLARRQGFKKGVDAGIYGGQFGSQYCGQFYKASKRDYKKEISTIKSDYSSAIRSGFKMYGSWDHLVRMKLNNHEIHLRKEYLSRMDKALKLFKRKNRSVLDE
jgi:hypothetical protein